MNNFPRSRFAPLFLVFALSLPPLVQDPKPSSEGKPQPAQQKQKEQEQEGVVRISTQLVQIDAVVTDKKGEHVEDLNADDFELTIDGKKQSLTYFNQIKLPEPKSSEMKAKPSDSPAPPATMPTKMLAPEDVKRTVAFVIDDLGLSFESTNYARRALKKFVDEQMQDGDLVGIIMTGRGLGALQQFTSDKRILYRAIEKMSWNPYSRDMIPRFGQTDDDDDPRSAEASQASREAADRFEDFQETVFSVGTLGALNFVVRGLRELPGRKVAILISDGFRLFGRNRDNTQVLDNVRRLTDLANRSSVVIYSIDAKGLQTLSPTAADNMRGTTGPQFADRLSRASQANFDSQEGLSYLARETGGFAVLNNNDVNFGIQKALHDTNSYYLVGFDPEDAKFDSRYHSIKLRVKRPGLQVRTRAGFIGFPDVKPKDEPLLSGPEERNRQIVSALFSPFGARDLSLQMTSFFFNSDQGGSFVRSLYNIDPSKLTFRDDPEKPGEKIVTIEIASFTFNEKGAIVDQHGRTFKMGFDDARYQLALKKGLLYTDDFVIKQPGAYQFRTVLRDAENGKLGSAGQFIQVPDLVKKRLAISGLILSSPPKKPQSPAAQEATAAAESSDVQPSPAVRRFSRTGEIDYGAVIYNAALDTKTGQPQVTAQVEIYQNGKTIYQGPVRPVEPQKIGETTRLACQGTLRLNGFPPGDYMMHVIVTDGLTKQKYGRVEQWMDFGVR
jgi:VWFA-related protein